MHSPPDPSHPVILVLDHSPVVPTIIRLMLKREAELSVQIVAFTNPTLAARWLTGSLDLQKAARHPLTTPWDHYPPRAQTQVGLAILDSEFAPVRKGLPVIDWIAALLPTGTPIVTISSEPMPARRRRHAKLPLLAHLHKPLETHDLIALLSPVLAAELPTTVLAAVPKQRKRWAIHRLVCWLRWW